jgi:hypothetical protein
LTEIFRNTPSRAELSEGFGGWVAAPTLAPFTAAGLSALGQAKRLRIAKSRIENRIANG